MAIGRSNITQQVTKPPYKKRRKRKKVSIKKTRGNKKNG